MSYLTHQEFQNRGDRCALLSMDDMQRPNLMALAWVDRDRRYFIASTSSANEGTPIVRKRLRQLVNDRTTEPERVEVTIPQPQVCETYYSCCGKIDQHNRDRQDTLGLEIKIKTHDWSQRVNLSNLG